MWKFGILEIGRWNLGLKNFKDEKKCELELFRSRIFNNQFLKFVGLEDGPRRMAMQGGAFGYGPKVGYGSNQHSSSWALDICTPRFKDAQFGLGVIHVGLPYSS